MGIAHEIPFAALRRRGRAEHALAFDHLWDFVAHKQAVALEEFEVRIQGAEGIRFLADFGNRDSQVAGS